MNWKGFADGSPASQDSPEVPIRGNLLRDIEMDLMI